MNYPFSINDLASKCNVSKQSIYNLMKKNQELINNNSIRKQRKIYYNQSVLDFFLAYYDKETTEAPIKTDLAEGSHPEGEKPLSESPSVEELPESRIKALENELEAKEAEIKRLNELLAAKEAERKELLNQNGALILTLQQEKQEKMLLLPAPRKPLGEKIKGLFNRKA